MIRTILHDRESGESRLGDAALLTEWVNDPHTWIWADFENEDLAHEKKLFSEVFGLHPPIIYDAQRDRHIPKLEEFDDGHGYALQRSQARGG
mgnify:CR=1 FL=1